MSDRPTMIKYVDLSSRLTISRDELARLEYAYNKKVASVLLAAIRRGAKSRELDGIKVLGNSLEDTKELDELKEQIFIKQKEVNELWGAVKGWEAMKELYRTDSYKNTSYLDESLTGE